MDDHSKRTWKTLGLLFGIMLATLLFFFIRRQSNPNNLILAKMEEDFSQVRHPADSTLVDEFSGWGNFSAHRQVFDVPGDYCDFWVFELRRYPGEPQAVLDQYQAQRQDTDTLQGLPLNLIFIEAIPGKTFKRTHQELGFDSYSDAFTLDFLNREYIYRFPAGLNEGTGELFFVYFLRTNVKVEADNGC